MGTKTLKPRQRRAKGNKGKVESLNDQQQVFVMECLADNEFNFTEAARKAGYKFPSQSAYKLLQLPAIKSALGKALHERMYRCEIDADRVLRELMEIGLADPIDMFDEETGNLLSIQDMPEGIRRAISSFEVEVKEDDEGRTTTTAKIKMHPKMAALELIAKHLGMLNDKLNIQHDVGPGLLSSLLARVEVNRGGGVIDDDFIEAEVVDAVPDPPKKKLSFNSNGKNGHYKKNGS